MNCPSCSQPVADDAPSCAGCGLSIELLDRKFGAVPRHFPHVTDIAAELTRWQSARLEWHSRYFERAFPQARFVMFLTRLPRGANVREYGFWLFNRARFSLDEARGGNNFSILLTIDCAGGQAAMTVGYGLELLLPEQTLREVLESVSRDFAKGRYYRGCERCLYAVIRLLKPLGVRGRPPAPVPEQAEAEIY